MRSGILAGGNWIVDNVKMIDIWPPQDALASISDESRGNGGSPYNILKNLSKLGAPFPIEAIGLIGNDELGNWILADCKKHQVDTRRLLIDPKVPTSYTDVMTVKSTGRRTFFHQRGANAKLAPEHFDFTGSNAKIFHLGYLLLLDALDASGPDGQPRAVEVLRAARKAGMATSVDAVSAADDVFQRIVVPTLPEVDYLIINDYEAHHITGISVRQGERLDITAVEKAAATMIKMGVKRWAVIHFPEGAYACDASGKGIWQPGLKLTKGDIAGAAGAGDAFATGVLYGIHEEWPMQKSLLVGVATAATSLSHPTCSDGVQSLENCLALAERKGLQTLPTR